MAGSTARRAKLRAILVMITLATLPLYCLGYFVMQRAQSQLKLNFATLASASTRVQTLQIFATATGEPGFATLPAPAVTPGGSDATLTVPVVFPTWSPVPEEFLRQYFQLIEQRAYPQTWALLTTHYRQAHNSTGYQPYVDFWNTVSTVSITNPQTVSQNQQSAQLKAQVSFIFTNGKSSTQTITFSLVADAASASWLIDDTY
jgi:hypothetical protein